MRFRVVALAIALIASSATAWADTIVSTFGPDDSFDSVHGQVETGGFRLAVSFTVPGHGAFRLDALQVAASWSTYSPSAPPIGGTLSLFRGSDPNVVREVEITRFTGIANQGIEGEFWSTPHIYTVPSVTHPILIGGASYFVQLYGPVDWKWYFNDQGHQGYYMNINSLGDTSEHALPWGGPMVVDGVVAPAFAFAIQATRVPEPITLVLVAIGTAGLVALHRRRGI